MSRFSDYLQKTFLFSSREVEEIIAAMIRPIGKSIRINTRKIALADFKIHATEQGWKLTDTDIPEVFLIDRDDTSIALGNTLEHQAGWFYIQEVAAAMPPHLLRREAAGLKTKNQDKRADLLNHSSLSSSSFNLSSLILDMCAAPGGKTTQLADYFPDSLIIANEVNRTRTPQLFDNLDRMGYDNIAVISCDGRFFQNFPEFFDAVLLDAPCSGEGTAFRDAAVIDQWNEKNIDRIAKLQKQLFATAETIVKPAGFVSYSTCTLNRVENEEVIESLYRENREHETEDTDDYSINSDIEDGRLKIEDGNFEKNNSHVSLLFSKRFWPHIEHTGGFFASIFQKISPVAPFGRSCPATGGTEDLLSKNSGSDSLMQNPPSADAYTSFKKEVRDYPVLAAKGQQKLIVNPATKGEREIVERFISKHLKSELRAGFLYTTKDGVYFNQKNLSPLAQYFYFVHAGMRIGTIKGNTFTPTHHIWWSIEETSLPKIEITREQWTDILNNKKAHFESLEGYYALSYGRGIIGVGHIAEGILKTKI